MRRVLNLPAMVLALVLAVCLAGFYLTRDTSNGKLKSTSTEGEESLIDQRLMQSARQLASLSDTADEQDLAREALRLTDHEMDQAYATALREATAPKVIPPGPLMELSKHIARLRAGLAVGQQHIAELEKKTGAGETASGELELAKALLALDQNELEDALQDFSRQGGDTGARIERAKQEHDNAQRTAPPPPKAATAVEPSTLQDQTAHWLALRNRGQLVLAARLQAAAKSATLLHEHNSLENLLANKPVETAPKNETEDTRSVVTRLRGITDQRKTLKELDQRIDDTKQLTDVYQRWSVLLEARRRGVLHQMLRLLAWILVIIIAVVLANSALSSAFRGPDRRRLHQARFIAQVAVQLVAVGIILIIIFGPPTQLSTIIGLATAGLTVVMKDFIMAFFGWFILIGRNGVRVGDWVEINGVGGEVIEIGLLKTVLLEMGNMGNSGYPTGRRVGFMNGYAIEGHYFNFSTAGQWLWDELQVKVPSGGDPYALAEEIRHMVERETDADAKQAAQEWERVTKQYGTRAFSARPAADIRPASGGVDVLVRYITKAPLRYEVKSRLFQAIVALLRKAESGGAR
jgi:small-conductance mechanosensitive channel